MNDKKLSNIKSQAVNICHALAKVKNPEFAHLMNLIRVNEDDIIVTESRSNTHIGLKFSIPVPVEFKPLYSTLSIRVNFWLAKNSEESISGGDIGYSYEHQDGVYNGKSIAWFNLDDEKPFMTIGWNRISPNPNLEELSWRPEIVETHFEEVSL